MAEEKVAIRIIPTPATQDISDHDIQRLARITRVTPDRIKERFAQGKGLTLVTTPHPKVNELVQLIKAIGFFVMVAPVRAAQQKAATSRKRRGRGSREPETEWHVGDVIENLYEVRDIKHGGMGAVYIVRHRRWNTMMAVKSLHHRLRAREEDRALFVKEAETWIDIGFHPNVAACYYVRSIRDSPRIFIEHVDGGFVTEWLHHRGSVGWDLVIDLMVQAGDGLDHAHSKGLVHRDVKPRNCLMTEDGILKVTDFGLTKREGHDGDTESGREGSDEETSGPERETVTAAGMGTPGYMAPEMWIPGAEVGREADIYAFGVMFFEICCGRKPFVLPVGETVQKLGIAHVKKQPPQPSSLRPDMPPQIERVILKCLQKNPDDRYHSFLQMRRELEGIYKELFQRRYPRERPDEVTLISDALNNRAVSLMDLNHEQEAETTLTSALQSDPHHAEAVYNLGLLGWMRTGNPDWDIVVRMEEVVKTPQYAGRGSYLLGRLLLALGDAPRALKASEQSLASEDASEEWLKPHGVALVGTGRDKESAKRLETYLVEFPDDDEAVGWLVGALIRCGKTERAASRLNALPPNSDLFGATVGSVAREYRYSGLDATLQIAGHAGWITCVNHFPRSGLLVTGTRDRTLKVWDAQTGEERKSVPIVGEPPGMVSISPDECLIAIAASQKAAAVKILDLASTRFVGNLLAQDIVTAVEFSPDGKSILTVEHRGLVRVWDAAEFKVVSSFKIPGHSAAAIVFEGVSRPVIFCAAPDRSVKKIRLGESEADSFEREHSEPITSLKVSPDGTRVLTSGRDRHVIVWDAASGRAITTFQVHQEQIVEIALNPCRDLAASYDPKAGVKVWDSRTGLVFRTFTPRDADVQCMAFTPDGTRLMAGGRDMTLRVWDVRGRPILPALALAQIRPLTKQIKSDRKFKAMLEAAIKAMKRGAYATAYSMLQDSRQLSGYERSDAALDLIVRMREHGTRTGLRGGWNRKTVETNSAVMDVRFSPTAINMLTAQADHTVRLWSARTGDCLKIFRGHTNLVTSVRFAGNGREAASGSDDRTARTWDLTTGKNLLVLKGHQDSISSVRYAPDGTCLASGSWDGTVKIWRLPDGGLLRTLRGSEDKITSIAWIGPAAERLVSAGFDGVVKMWDVASGRLLRELKGHKDRITGLAVSTNGEQMWTASADGTARAWDLRLGREKKTCEVCQAGLRAVDLSPDGMFIAAGGSDGVLRVWSGETGQGLRDFQGHAREITANTFSSNARFIVSSSAEGSVMVWELDWDWRFTDKKILH